MKILHVIDHSLPLHSGYTFRSQNIFRAQLERGWSPVVVTSPKHEQNLPVEAPEREEIGGVTYYRTGATTTGRLPFEYELRLMHRLSRRILSVANLEQPEVIHAHSPVLNAFPALWAGRKLGVPVVYEIRAFWEDAAVDHGTYAEDSWKYRLTQWLETQVCKRADQIAILCNGLKNDLVSRGIPADNITPVFNGVNPDDFKSTEPDHELMVSWRLEGKKVIGFIGSFYRYEGLDLLIEAFASLASAHPESILLLVGGGEVAEELAAQARQLGLEDRVVMPGRIDHNKVPGVYALIDVLAYPRRAMRLTELVTPLKPLEAMAMGKVLVASDVGGHKELIRHAETGMLFPAGDVAALADSLGELLNDTTLGESIASKAADWVVSYHTWRKTTSVYEAIYSQATAGSTFHSGTEENA